MKKTASPVGLWAACAEMEAVASNVVASQLSEFEAPVRRCYEAGVQVLTLRAKDHRREDIAFAAVFLKRTLTDLRSVWNLLIRGYTSQAASVSAALFEHALGVNALAGSPENVAKLKESQSDDLPWTPIQLSKILAAKGRDTESLGGRSSDGEFEKAWREVYAAYKFLCKIKHPTLRSLGHDASNTVTRTGEYVVIAAPDVRPQDVALKATVLMISVSRCFAAIRCLATAIDCDLDTPEYGEFSGSMELVHRDVLAAYQRIAGENQLPFTIRDERLTEEYLKHTPESM